MRAREAASTGSDRCEAPRFDLAQPPPRKLEEEKLDDVFSRAGVGELDERGADHVEEHDRNSVTRRLAPFSSSPKTITITANADGSFSPSSVTIKKGDTVTWVGLRRTDSLVHLTDDAVDVCDPNDGAPYIPGGVDEFTGPWRTGVPGIFARGPTEPGQGPGVVPATMDCEQDPSPELATVDGVPSKYCAGQVSLEQHLLTEMWDYPEINGALILFDWDAIETADDVYDFTDLDHEMTAAMKAGKSIRLAMRAGQEATPPWIFSAGVFPVQTKDTNNSDLSLSGNSCGMASKMASPNDPVFRELAAHPRHPFVGESLLAQGARDPRDQHRLRSARRSLPTLLQDGSAGCTGLRTGTPRRRSLPHADATKRNIVRRVKTRSQQ